MLSERESQIVKLVSQGYSNKQIGQDLFLAEQTIKTYISQGMRKLGANNRTRLVVLAMERGILGIGRHYESPDDMVYPTI